MKGKKVIRKIILLTAWLLVGGGMTTLLVAANQKEQGHVCKEVRISIKGDGEQFFIDKNDILQLLNKAAGRGLVNQPLEKMGLSALEQALEKGVWIRDAELYIDSKDVLHVQVTEREPIARIFTRAGTSFYIDSSGKQMPLLEKESARVLLITNFTAARVYNAKDSAQAKEVKYIARTIAANPFWRKQIAQVDITPSGTYEAIPVIGNHIIRLGTAEDLEGKLDRLYQFYKQVLSKTGFDKYDVVDVQYVGQVIGIHKGTAVSPVDSVQLAKNIKELLERSRQQMINDSLAQLQQNSALAEAALQEPPVTVSADTLSKSHPTPAKPKTFQAQSKEVAQPAKTPITQKPKAVMQRQSNKKGSEKSG